jgi:2-polyprenyl-6-methoxyphenol hydroxylase-like FAD-dependent oxidoreductase
MKITIVGAGPAGLYFALLMKKANASHQITVLERDGADDTFGWGIVFSDQTFAYLEESDEPSFRDIVAARETWDNVDVVHRGEKISIHGNRFSGIARIAFLKILQRRAAALGVDLRFRTPVADVAQLEPYDLLVGADGANSQLRQHYAGAFGPDVSAARNKYIWLGTPRLFHGLTLTFRETAWGPFAAHSYKFSPALSTFIVECGPETWAKAGFAGMAEAETCDRLAAIFSDDLSGAPLLTNNFVRWLNFTLVRNRRWWTERVVLLGDALHTAHFSIGSGTKLALEDAIALAKAFADRGEVADALPYFQQQRKPIVDGMQDAALESLRWFENMGDDFALDPIVFAYRLMTRSGRLDKEKLRRRDHAFVAAYERAVGPSVR